MFSHLHNVWCETEFVHIVELYITLAHRCSQLMGLDQLVRSPSSGLDCPRLTSLASSVSVDKHNYDIFL